MDHDIISRILYCDSNCVVVNKIAGEACEGAGKGMTDLPRLLAAVLNTESNQPSASPLEIPAAVHRLDVPVSGCALFARNEAALRFLNETFNSTNVSNDNAVKKIYWAVVEQPKSNALFPDICTESLELVHWIQFDSRRNKSIAHDQRQPGLKKAILRYRLAGKGHNYLFLEIDLITGRHHQIRAQFERMGLHIKGDLKYGARRSEPNGGIRLHARSLSFPNPSDKNNRITIQADPPNRDNLWQAWPGE
jgi:23S rRNA pseudouridine1911/1915/1917 synthase